MRTAQFPRTIWPILLLPLPLTVFLSGCVEYVPTPVYLPPPPRVIVPPAAYAIPAPYPPPPPPVRAAPRAAVTNVAPSSALGAPGLGGFSPEEEPDGVVSMYVQPPVGQPEVIAVPWAPPPMLVDEPPPAPFPDAVWIGGSWAWQGLWVWDHGRWAAPPQPGYVWVPPYYEHRMDIVLFVAGHWTAFDAPFEAPSPRLYVVVERPRPLSHGVACIGPEGVFVPAPPGSLPGIIVPAPVGTPPAVVASAPSVIHVGMHVVDNSGATVIDGHGTITRHWPGPELTVVAPASATASGEPVRMLVPTQADLAATRPALVAVTAPPPASHDTWPAFVHGQRLDWLPTRQPLRVAPQRPATPITVDAVRPPASPMTVDTLRPPAPPITVDAPHPAGPQANAAVTLLPPEVTVPAGIPTGHGLPINQHLTPQAVPLQPLEGGPPQAVEEAGHSHAAPRAVAAAAHAPTHGPHRLTPTTRNEPRIVQRPIAVNPPAALHPPAASGNATPQADRTSDRDGAH